MGSSCWCIWHSLVKSLIPKSGLCRADQTPQATWKDNPLFLLRGGSLQPACEKTHFVAPGRVPVGWKKAPALHEAVQCALCWYSADHGPSKKSCPNGGYGRDMDTISEAWKDVPKHKKNLFKDTSSRNACPDKIKIFRQDNKLFSTGRGCGDKGLHCGETCSNEGFFCSQEVPC